MEARLEHFLMLTAKTPDAEQWESWPESVGLGRSRVCILGEVTALIEGLGLSVHRLILPRPP